MLPRILQYSQHGGHGDFGRAGQGKRLARNEERRSRVEGVGWLHRVVEGLHTGLFEGVLHLCDHSPKRQACVCEPHQTPRARPAIGPASWPAPARGRCFHDQEPHRRREQPGRRSRVPFAVRKGLGDRPGIHSDQENSLVGSATLGGARGLRGRVAPPRTQLTQPEHDHQRKWDLAEPTKGPCPGRRRGLPRSRWPQPPASGAWRRAW